MSGQHRARGRLRALVATAALALVVVGAGCGSDSGSDAGGSTQSANSSNADLKVLSDRIDAAKAVPEFTYGGKPIDARSVVAGKSVANVPWGNSVQYPALIADGMERAAGTVGLRWKTESVNGPDQWAQGVETAVAQNPSLISLLILDPRAVRPQIQTALDKDIDVVSEHFWDSSQGDLAEAANLTGWVGLDYVTPARLLADWTIVDSDAKANVLIIGGPDFTFNEPVLEAMRSEFSENCPDCTYKIVNIPAVDWASKIPSTVAAEVQTNPDLSYVIPYSDGGSTGVLDGLRQANAVGKVKIATFGTAPAILDLVHSGDVAINCGYSTEWSAYGFVDQVLRTLDGQTADAEIRNGLRCFDQSNVDEAGVPAKPGQGWGDAYVSGYEQLWGLG